MKKLLVLWLAAAMLVMAATGALAEVKVTVGGEGNFGYDFAKKDLNKDDGASFSDFAITAKAEIDDNFVIFGKFKAGDTAGGGVVSDEVYTTFKVAPVSFKVGYYGWGFGGSKDILDVPMGDLKSQVGIQAEVPLAEGLTGKVFVPLKGEKPVNDTESGAFGVRLDYSKDVYGFGVIYGQSEWKYKDRIKVVVNGEETLISQYDNAKAYTVTAFVKPIPDLKAYVDYSTLTADVIAGGEKDNTAIIVGAYYTPANLPIEIRAEYDLDDENDIANWKDHNPWAVRFAYKINAKVKIEANRNQKNATGNESAVKLNICF